MVNEREGKMRSGKIIGYYLISLAIGIGIAFESYELISFFGYEAAAFLSYMVPEAIIGIFCFTLKRSSREIWNNKQDRFICLGFLISGYFITSMALNIKYFYLPRVKSIYGVILLSLILKFYWGSVYYLIAIAVSIYATGDVTGWRKVLAVLVLSIFIFWPGPFLLFPA